ncbi:ABC transporter permease [Bacteroidia bacterium]|nr:ABC transporter permease [Bacteroidia bacterium]
MDTLYEILASIRRNKLRTILTGFSVAWGIFMLIVLLGSGNGLMNGVQSNFRDQASNVIRIFPGWTSMSHDGLEKGRRITIKAEDLEMLAQQFPEHIELVTPQLRRRGTQVARGNEYSVLQVEGVYPEYMDLQGVRVLAGKGRNINYQDINEYRKVILIHPKTATVLFPNEDPIGDYVKLNNVLFQVAGIYDADGSSEERAAYIPYSTAQIFFNKGNKIDAATLAIKNLPTLEANEKFVIDVRQYLSTILRFHPEDRNAVWMWNRFDDYLQTQFIFSAISIAIWIIGLFSLISGIVGVGNIMLISVKERTKEFGIRKAIGASPWNILRVVIMESIIITAIFGYIGMFLGIGVTELLNYVLESTQGPKTGNDPTMFLNPTIDMSIAIAATATLVIAGTLAGFFPARKAVTIKPVEALTAK